jgi:hypothetical protein
VNLLLASVTSLRSLISKTISVFRASSPFLLFDYAHVENTMSAYLSRSISKGDYLYETQSTRIRVCGSSLHFAVSTGGHRRGLLWESRML